MAAPSLRLQLPEAQKRQLEALARSGKTTQKIGLRARIVLLAGQGIGPQEIARRLETSRPTVWLWRRRFGRMGVEGLLKDAPRPGRKKAISPQIVQAVVEKTLHTKPPGQTHWSVRTMARAMGLSRMTIQRIWRQHGLQPHRVETFKLSRDPHFVEKLRDVVGLYLNPPEKALVLSVDEKGGIQALERTAPLLPLRPGVPARQSHDYKRHGTTTLFAALQLLDGTVIGECMPRRRSVEFIRFLKRLDRETSPQLALHLIVDNLSTHKSPPVKRWLERHPRFHLHFTPTGSSWLNLVERWLRDLTEKAIRRGSFTSVEQVQQAIYAYLDESNRNPKVFSWTKSADMILAKINRCKEALGTPH